MQLRYLALAALLCAASTAGCHDKAKENKQAAAAAKSAEEAEIDDRAKVVAQGLIQKAADDAEKKREAAEQQRVTALRQLRQETADHPGTYISSSSVQVSETGKRRLTSVALTNNSKFSISEIHGTVDFHGGSDSQGNNGDILAQVPIELTGSIAPGASLVFSEQQKTLTGSAIQLTKVPTSVTFTVTKVTVGSEGLDLGPVGTPLAADAGVR